jgi:hypothetical protein
MPVLSGRRLLCSVSFNDAAAVFSETMRLSTDPIQRRISGKATKTWKQEPNTCNLEVYNLSSDMRAQLSAAKTPTIKLAAGYGADANLTQIFYGQAIFVKHEIKDADIITTLSTTDGGKKKQTARIHVSFGPGTPTSQVLRRIVQELGIKPGNVDTVARDLDKGIKASIYAEGVTISGSAADELGHLCRSVGYDYSIQDGAMQLLKIGQAKSDVAVVLDNDSGLIGSPSISNDGVVNGQCLIFKAGAGLDLVPGRRIDLRSEFLKGFFILAKCEFSFDNYADDWYCNFEAVAKKGDFQLVK